MIYLILAFVSVDYYDDSSAASATPPRRYSGTPVGNYVRPMSFSAARTNVFDPPAVGICLGYVTSRGARDK